MSENIFVNLAMVTRLPYLTNGRNAHADQTSLAAAGALQSYVSVRWKLRDECRAGVSLRRQLSPVGHSAFSLPTSAWPPPSRIVNPAGIGVVRWPSDVRRRTALATGISLSTTELWTTLSVRPARNRSAAAARFLPCRRVWLSWKRRTVRGGSISYTAAPRAFASWEGVRPTISQR